MWWWAHPAVQEEQPEQEAQPEQDWHRENAFANPLLLTDNNFDFFICHYGKDTKETLAMPSHYILEKFGHRVFLDRFMEPGHYQVEEISRGLYSCRFGVIIISDNFHKSEWCRIELKTLYQRLAKQDELELIVFFESARLADLPMYKKLGNIINVIRQGGFSDRQYLIGVMIPTLLKKAGYVAKSDNVVSMMICPSQSLRRNISKHLDAYIKEPNTNALASLKPEQTFTCTRRLLCTAVWLVFVILVVVVVVASFLAGIPRSTPSVTAFPSSLGPSPNPTQGTALSPSSMPSKLPVTDMMSIPPTPSHGKIETDKPTSPPTISLIPSQAPIADVGRADNDLQSSLSDGHPSETNQETTAPTAYYQSGFPSYPPSESPATTTASPSTSPSAKSPLFGPTFSPSTLNPTAKIPSPLPTSRPTPAPTIRPTPFPTRKPPTPEPSRPPKLTLTKEPTPMPQWPPPTPSPTTTSPTKTPTFPPTSEPTPEPTTKQPTVNPTKSPTPLPTHVPTTVAPTPTPTPFPTFGSILTPRPTTTDDSGKVPTGLTPRPTFGSIFTVFVAKGGGY